ncbi:hypothetical protein A3Q56_02668 [Intoshia linei]|uniref:MSP domain-containing protein n=1 Tax=Intoshia linei TaxID=1819745 RepID=A0A177B7D6_9BILA|nr:hypothetical protein A3Q56_02668 [Intoshia linei]
MEKEKFVEFQRILNKNSIKSKFQCEILKILKKNFMYTTSKECTFRITSHLPFKKFIIKVCKYNILLTPFINLEIDASEAVFILKSCIGKPYIMNVDIVNLSALVKVNFNESAIFYLSQNDKMNVTFVKIKFSFKTNNHGLASKLKTITDKFTDTLHNVSFIVYLNTFCDNENEYVYEYKENMFDHPPLNSENFTNFEGYSDYTFPGEPKQKPLESSTIDFSESMKVQTSQNKSINLEKLSIICSRENISENSYQGENKRKNDVKCTENEIQRERNKEGQCSDSIISKLDKNKKNLKNKEIKENNTCANCYSTPKKHKSFLSFYKFGKSPKKQKIVKNDNKEKIEKDANEKNNFRNSFKRFKNKKLNMDKSINSRVEIQDNNSSWEFVEVRPNRQSQKQSNYSEKMWDLSTNSSITPYDCKSQTVHDKILKRFRNSVLYRKVPKIHDKNIVTYINPEGSDIKINCDSLQSIIVKILSMKNGSKSIYDYGYRVKDNLTDCVLRPNKIMFKCDIDCQLYTVIRLKNIGAEYKIFRVECSESNYFTIQPNFGILSHGEEMTVSLFANEDKISNVLQYMHKVSVEKLKEIVIQTKIADRIDYPPIYPDDIVTLTVSTSNMLSSIQDKVECKRLHFSLKMLNSVYTGRTRAAFCGSNNQMVEI